MIGESVLKLSFLFESLGELFVHMNTLDVTVFECDSKLCEFLIQFLNHFVGHLSFKIVDLTKPDRIDKSSDVFVDFSIKKFVKPTST